MIEYERTELQGGELLYTDKSTEKQPVETIIVDPGGKLVTRRTISFSGAAPDAMVVASLDGVNVYIRGGFVCVTKKELYL